MVRLAVLTGLPHDQELSSAAKAGLTGTEVQQFDCKRNAWHMARLHSNSCTLAAQGCINRSGICNSGAKLTTVAADAGDLGDPKLGVTAATALMHSLLFALQPAAAVKPPAC